MSTIIESIEQRQLRQVPRFAAGDRVRVHFQVIEGTRKRTQVFEGIVIARQGSGARETFTVRKQSFGVGVERTFPLHSPKIEQLEVVARGDVRRAKLYYLRGRVGKRARVAERRWGIEDDLVQSPRSRWRSIPRARPEETRSSREGRAREGRGARRRAEAAGRCSARRSQPGTTDPRASRRPPTAGEAEAEAEGDRRSGARDRRGFRGTQADPEADDRSRGASSSSSSSSRSRSGSRSASRRSSSSRTRSRRSRWSRRSTSASGCSSTGSSTASATPARRRRRLPPAEGARRSTGPSAARRKPSRAALPPAGRRRRPTRTSSSGSSPGRATRSRSRTGIPVVNGESQGDGEFIAHARDRRRLRTSRRRSPFRPTTTS